MGFMKASRKPAAEAQQMAAQEAADSRAREEARAARLREGSSRVNKAFDGFGDDYYKGVSDNVETLGMADLDTQWKKARENLMFALARNGMLSSTVANQGAADIQQNQAEAAGKIKLQARDAATKVRSGVENERAGAISQLYATEDPDTAANTALTRSALIQQDQPAYNPLGDIFAGVVNAYSTVAANSNRASGGSTASGPTAPSALRTGVGGRVVGGV